MTAITTVGVAGSGTMGAGIAIVAARAGFRTLAYDVSQQALDRARRLAEGYFATAAQCGACLDRLESTTDLAGMAACDLIVEAVPEDLAVKRDLLARLDRICPEDTIFASNTSALAITEIAAGSGRDERVVGLHFRVPAEFVKLVEVSPGLRTGEETFARAWAFCQALGQVPVESPDSPGFIIDRLLVPFDNDAIRLVEAGVAQPADIDRAIKAALGHAMGPLERLDLIGLDNHLRVAEALYAGTRDPRAAPPALLRRMVAAGRLGRKTGRGFHRYGGAPVSGD